MLTPTPKMQRERQTDADYFLCWLYKQTAGKTSVPCDAYRYLMHKRKLTKNDIDAMVAALAHRDKDKGPLVRILTSIYERRGLLVLGRFDPVEKPLPELAEYIVELTDAGATYAKTLMDWKWTKAVLKVVAEIIVIVAAAVLGAFVLRKIGWAK